MNAVTFFLPIIMLQSYLRRGWQQIYDLNWSNFRFSWKSEEKNLATSAFFAFLQSAIQYSLIPLPNNDLNKDLENVSTNNQSSENIFNLKN